MGILIQPELWADGADNTPPLSWEALATDDRWWFTNTTGDYAPGSDQSIHFIGPDALPASLTFEWEVVEPANNSIRFVYSFGSGNTEQEIPNEVGAGSITVDIPEDTTFFSWGIQTDIPSGSFYTGTIAVGEGASPPTTPTCDEMGRATRAYVSAYDRSRVHQSRLYRFERRCFVANFNGAIPPARTIVSATWRTDAPYIGVISDAQISPSPDARETMVMFAAQLGGWANLRAEVTLDNGEIYNQVFRVNVREASVFFDDPAIAIGPYSLTVSA